MLLPNLGAGRAPPPDRDPGRSSCPIALPQTIASTAPRATNPAPTPTSPARGSARLPAHRASSPGTAPTMLRSFRPPCSRRCTESRRRRGAVVAHPAGLPADSGRPSDLRDGPGLPPRRPLAVHPASGEDLTGEGPTGLSDNAHVSATAATSPPPWPRVVSRTRVRNQRRASANVGSARRRIGCGDPHWRLREQPITARLVHT